MDISTASVPSNAVLLHAQAGVPEAGARWLFQQILVAVDFCHRLGIALRDIKVRAALATPVRMPARAPKAAMPFPPVTSRLSLCESAEKVFACQATISKQ